MNVRSTSNSSGIVRYGAIFVVYRVEFLLQMLRENILTGFGLERRMAADGYRTGGGRVV